MQNVQAVFVDCDGVLYDVDLLTYDEIVAAGRQAGKDLGLDWADFDKIHASLKERHYHGFYNTVLKLCQAQGVSFDALAQKMVNILDYSRIKPDEELLPLLQKVALKKKLYIFTNNTRAHLEKVFNQLFNCSVQDSALAAITAESTLENGYFYPKRMEGVFTKWCKKIGVLPQNTLMLDDTNTVIEAAQKEGLQYRQIENAQMTKLILKELNEEHKRNSHLRQTSCRISDSKSTSCD